MSDFKDFIDTLRARISIVDVISKRVKLTKRGHDYFGLCPFHNEKTGSFKVDPVKGLFYCFGCNANGDMFKFVMLSEGLDFVESVKYIANLANVTVPQFSKKDEAKNEKSVLSAIKFVKDSYISARSLALQKNKVLADYISYRGLTEEDLDKFEIGFADVPELYRNARKDGFSDDVLQKTGVFFKKIGGIADKFDKRLIFPISDPSGKCIGFGGRTLGKDLPKYLNSPETNFFKKSDNLYAYHLARKGKFKELILVEGYMDVVSMHSAGFDKTVACLGTTISDRQIDLCWKISDSPIVMLDGDLPGIKAAHRWLLKILPKLEPGKTFRFVKLPDDGDPDSIIKSGGASYMSDILRSAVSLRDWLWESSFALYPSQTPENAASVLKFISDSIDTIQDKNIKILYKNWFTNQEKNYLFQQGKQSPRVAKKTGKISVNAIPSKIIKLQEILLATIINHPAILGKIIEDFIELDFQNSAYSWMQKEIITCQEKGEDFSTLVDKGDVSFKNVTLHAKFADKSNSDEIALEGWNDVFCQYKKLTTGQNELSGIGDSLGKDFSYDDWQRFKNMKNAILKSFKD